MYIYRCEGWKGKQHFRKFLILLVEFLVFHLKKNLKINKNK